jgi:uncharacterized protein (TIGR03437 family)
MAAAFLLVALAVGPLWADTSGTAGAPVYTADSIANSAANVAGFYAPNSFLTIYGQNLSYVTRAIGPGDISGGLLPTVLAGADVIVLINKMPANVYFVSPNQVNVLISPYLIPGPVTVQLGNNGLYGPAIQIVLTKAAPVLFQSDSTTVIATHGNGPLVTAAAPAQAGEVVVLYATGLGPTAPPAIANEIPLSAASIADRGGFRLLLNGSDVDPSLVLYAGVTPGFAGLFQINLRLPDGVPQNPEIRIGFGSSLSPPGRILPVQ